MEQDWAIQSIRIKKTVPLEEAQDIYKKVMKKKPRKVREKGDWYRFRVIPPTKFQPKSFRTKVVNENIQLTFGVIKEENKRLVGAGFFDYFKKAYDYVATKASDAFDYVKKAVSINDYSDTTKKYLQQYGNLPVLAIELRRAPLNVAIDLALQGVSKGKWLELKKKYGFDKFWHLSMLLTVGGAIERKIRNGRVIKEPKKLAIEKLAVVSINENITIESDMETQTVNVPTPFTINEMFNRAREKFGDTRFFSYSALGNNNCQNFIKMLLEVMDLYSAEVNDFVFQDISQLVEELPEATKTISQGITDIGALANKYLGIGGRKNRFRSAKKPCWEGYEMVGMKEKDGRQVPNCVENKKIGGNNKKMSLDDLYGDISTDKKGGGNKASGFIRAMMAKDTGRTNSDDWKDMSARERREANKKKFGDNDKMDVKELSKTTHDLLDTQKVLTRNQAIKRFYDYVKAHAQQHEPLRDGGKNFVGTFDMNDLYDRWKQTEGVEVRRERQQRRSDAVVEEEVGDLFRPRIRRPVIEEEEPPRIPRPVIRRPVIEEEEPPRQLSEREILRLNRGQLLAYLRGKTAQQIDKMGNRAMIEDMATILGVNHRVGKSRTKFGTAQNIFERLSQ